MKEKGLYRFETLAQELIEGKIARLFGGRLQPLDVANRLAQVMVDHSPNGAAAATFTIHLNSQDYHDLLQSNPDLADDIADTAWRIWQNSTSKDVQRPVVNLAADETVKRHKVHIVDDSDPGQTGREDTALISSKMSQSPAMEALLQRDAFLIIQGRRHVALDKAVTTIGRSVNNDIVLSKTTVSRKHAQIRWRFGRFVLYDISGRGQTSVNGQQILEQALQSGDVIALGGVLLIYGEGDDFGEGGVDDGGDKTIIPKYK